MDLRDCCLRQRHGRICREFLLHELVKFKHHVLRDLSCRYGGERNCCWVSPLTSADRPSTCRRNHQIPPLNSWDRARRYHHHTTYVARRSRRCVIVVQVCYGVLILLSSCMPGISQSLKSFKCSSFMSAAGMAGSSFLADFPPPSPPEELLRFAGIECKRGHSEVPPGQREGSVAPKWGRQSEFSAVRFDWDDTPNGNCVRC